MSYLRYSAENISPRQAVIWGGMARLIGRPTSLTSSAFQRSEQAPAALGNRSCSFCPGVKLRAQPIVCLRAHFVPGVIDLHFEREHAHEHVVGRHVRANSSPGIKRLQQEGLTYVLASLDMGEDLA